MENNGQAHKQQHNTQASQQMLLNPRLNEQNKSDNEQSQQLQQSFQTNQQVPLHILQIQQLQHNAQQNQLSSYEHSSQIQRNGVQNQQSIQQSPHSLQQNHHSVQVFSLLQDQQAVMRSAHILQSCSTAQQALARSKPKPTVGALQQELHHQQNRPDSNNSVAVHENEGPISEKCDSSTSSSSSQDLRDGFNRDIRELEDLLSKLNPMAKEFVPPSFANHASAISLANAFLHNSNNTNININGGSGITNLVNNNNTRRKTNYQGKRRMNSRTSIAQRDDSIRRTVYVSDIDQQVTEEQLAALFINCGQVVDCRVCGDPNSVLRFAFVEFVDEEGARAALSLAGTMLGYYPVRVLPSKTAIAPVNPTFLPRSEDEREMCARTIYCTNIDKKVSQADVKLFFQLLCGEVSRLRLLGDYHHSTRIAFVEFVMAESAIAALNCSGAILGSLPIRVSPSKTPVRPRTSRAPMH